MAQKAENTKNFANFVRIASTDVKSNATLMFGLSSIKGVGEMFANAVCVALKLDRNSKVSALSEKDIERIEEFLANPKKEGIPTWMLNHRREYASGENLHYTGKDIDFHDMQIKRRLAKIKTYRGLRLKIGLTVRGQRTRSNFRKNKTIASMKAKGSGRKK